jgi:hypothetical protein
MFLLSYCDVFATVNKRRYITTVETGAEQIRKFEIGIRPIRRARAPLSGQRRKGTRGIKPAAGDGWINCIETRSSRRAWRSDESVGIPYGSPISYG